ncbi:SWIM zinc finger family protein, partial [Pseudomonas sp. UBA2684]
MTLDILRLRQEHWRADFGAGDLQRGIGYAEQGRSTLLSLKDHTLLASCRGSGAQTYQQRITLYSTGRQWNVSGRCSCPVGFNCKHVAAALLTLETQQQAGVDLSPLIVPSADVAERRIEGVQPQAVLTLGSHVRVHFDARKGRMHEQTQHRAALAFDYQGHLAYGKATKDLLVRPNPAEQLRIVRDAASEAQLRQRLEDSGLYVALRQSEALAQHPGEHFELVNEVAWLAFVQHSVPQLREDGWRVQMQPEFQYNLARVDDWYAEIEETPERDWFDLELGIEVEGQRLSLLPILLQAIRRTPWLLTGDSLAQRPDEDLLLVNLPQSSRRIALPFARLKPLLATLGELFFQDPSDANPRLRLPRADAARLGGLEQGPPLKWQG